jgi:hypothetical protein
MPELPELELDQNHIYRLDGVQIPGCTAVLSAMGCTPGFNWLTPEQLEFYRSRGHAIHKAVELAVCGTLDKRTIAAEINPYLIGWDRFCEDHKVEVMEGSDGEPFVEHQLYHSAYRYGVTPDVVAVVDGLDAIVEIKATSAHAPATGLQLAAQLLAIRQSMKLRKVVARIGLRLLQKEPYYDLKFYTERSDEAVWLSLLNSYSWLARHKLLKENHR